MQCHYCKKEGHKEKACFQKKKDQKEKEKESAKQATERVEFAVMTEEMSFAVVRRNHLRHRLRAMIAWRILVDSGNTKALFPLGFEQFAENFREVKTTYETANGTMTTTRDATFRIPLKTRDGKKLVVVIEGSCSGIEGDTALIPPSVDFEMSRQLGTFHQSLTNDAGVVVSLNGSLEGSLAPIYVEDISNQSDQVSSRSWEDIKLNPHRQ